MSKKIIRQVPAHSLSFIPKSEEISIDNFSIGQDYETSEFMHQGDTKTTRHYYYDIGFDVSNRSSYPMRIQFTLDSKGQDEYTNQTKYIWDDIPPNSKKRLWSNVNYYKIKNYKGVTLSHIGMGPTPPGGKSEKAKWNQECTPQANVYDALDLGSVTTMAKKKRRFWIIFIIVIVILLWYAS